MMQFTKYSGSGNDFIFIDNRAKNLELTKNQIISFCKRREGIGADGVVLINQSDNYDYKMRIFNADASEAEMCGNAARCSIHFAFHSLNLGKNGKYEFETMNGVYQGEVVGDNEVKVKMTELYDVDAIDLSDLSGKKSMYLNTGVPHAVIQVSRVSDVKVNSIGSAIRHDKRFQNGTNVDFFEVVNEASQSIKLRVYERGVEDETLCCGTGIMATAVSCSNFFDWYGEINIEVPGGKLKAIVDKELNDLYFQGPVKLMYEGSFSE